MARITLWSLLLLVFGIESCKAQHTNQSIGVLEGVIGLYEGNCMPGPGIPPCEPKPISAMILITSVTEKFNPDLLIDSVKSDTLGKYSIELEVGNYSLFLRDGDEIVCTEIQCPDLCICSPFSIQSNSKTIVDANLDHASW